VTAVATPIRVLIIAQDDERVRRVREALAEHDDVDIVGEVSSFKEAMWVVDELLPDLVIFTGASRGRAWMRFVRWMTWRRPDIELLWTEDPGFSIAEAIQAGVSEYLLKGVGTDELVNALASPSRGRP
jgi:DNA-binding NarL/FixJ family response regulator